MDLLSLFLLTAVFTIRDLPVEAAEVTFGDSTGNVTVLMWGQARLPCIVTGQGLGTNQNVVWFQSTRGLALTLNRFILPSEFSKGNRLAFTAPGSKEDWGLLINDVRQSDDGVYQCVVNTRPVRKKHVNLRVVSPPTLSSDLPQSISVTAGNYVLLECEASGIPVPVVNWFRINDTRVLVGEGEQYLMPYIMPDQAGTYQCTADNGVPQAGYLQFNVEVLFRPTAEIVAPSRTDILLGSDVTITARCTSNPKSSARWLKDDVALSFTDPPDRYGFWNKHDTFSLKIQRVTEQDLGFFMVDCENFLARSVQKVELTRLEAPQVDLERSSRNQTVLVGETLDLQCHSTTLESNFSWYRTDDHEIDHVTEVPIGTGNTLTLPSVQIPDAGLYACMTGNMAGYTIHFIAVDVKGSCAPSYNPQSTTPSSRFPSTSF